MVNALRLVFSGGIYIPPEALVRAEAKEAQPVPGRPGLAGRSRLYRTPDGGACSHDARARATRRSLASSMWPKPTVKHHVTAILKALKVTNRTEAVIAVGALGWQLPRVPE